MDVPLNIGVKVMNQDKSLHMSGVTLMHVSALRNSISNQLTKYLVDFTLLCKNMSDPRTDCNCLLVICLHLITSLHLCNISASFSLEAFFSTVLIITPRQLHSVAESLICPLR